MAASCLATNLEEMEASNPVKVLISYLQLNPNDLCVTSEFDLSCCLIIFSVTYCVDRSLRDRTNVNKLLVISEQASWHAYDAQLCGVIVVVILHTTD